MARGKLFKIERPFVSEEAKIILSEEGGTATVNPTGPMGGPRPGTEPTPKEEDNISEALKKCIESDGADEYIKGLENAYGINIPEKKAYLLKKKWCQGEMEAFTTQ